MWRGVPVSLQPLRERERRWRSHCTHTHTHSHTAAVLRSLLPDSTGIDLGQLVWGRSLPDSPAESRIIYYPVTCWSQVSENQIGKGLWSKPSMWSRNAIRVHHDAPVPRRRKTMLSFSSNARSSGISSKRTDSLGKGCIPHGNCVYGSKLSFLEIRLQNFPGMFTFSEESLPSEKRLEDGVVWERQDKRAVPLPPS